MTIDTKARAEWTSAILRAHLTALTGGPYSMQNMEDFLEDAMVAIDGDKKEEEQEDDNDV